MWKYELMLGAAAFMLVLALSLTLFGYQFSSCTEDNSFMYCTFFYKLYW